MERNFTREKEEWTALAAMEKKKIGVISMGPGSGATLVALALAQQLVLERESVAFLELPRALSGQALTYDSLGMEKRFSLKPYQPLFFAIKNRTGIKSLHNRESGIHWGLMTPGENREKIRLSLGEKLHLIHNITGDFVLCDLGTDYHSRLLMEMDYVFCVVDPLPSKLIANRDMFETLSGDKRVVWVENKHNSGVMKRSFSKYMRRKMTYRIPLLPGELFYRKEYNCRLPYEQREIREILQPVIKEMVDHHIIHKKR